jgi:hypothetical protein
VRQFIQITLGDPNAFLVKQHSKQNVKIVFVMVTDFAMANGAGRGVRLADRDRDKKARSAAGICPAYMPASRWPIGR